MHRADSTFIGGLLQYFGPAGWWTMWYWEDGTRGKVWNFFHGNGWRIA